MNLLLPVAARYQMCSVVCETTVFSCDVQPHNSTFITPLICRVAACGRPIRIPSHLLSSARGFPGAALCITQLLVGLQCSWPQMSISASHRKQTPSTLCPVPDESWEHSPGGILLFQMSTLSTPSSESSSDCTGQGKTRTCHRGSGREEGREARGDSACQISPSQSEWGCRTLNTLETRSASSKHILQ